MEESLEKTNNDAWIVSRKKLLLDIAVTVVSATLFATAFPPLNWYFMIWCALTPFYFVIRSKTPIKAFCYGILWGYVWAVISFYWLREIEPFIPFVMAFIMAMYPAVWAFFVPVFRHAILIPVEVRLAGSEGVKKYTPKVFREILMITSLTALWVLLEWCRSRFMSGFPWNLAGISQWQNIPVIQICEYTGVFGISFLIIFFNLALALTVDSVRRVVSTGRYRRPVPFVLAMILLMIAVLTGVNSMMHYSLPVRPDTDPAKKDFILFTAAVIQGDIPQCRFPKEGEAENALTEYLNLSELAVMNRPDIVIWPETAVPVPYRTGYDFGETFRFGLFKLMNKSKIPFLIGTVDFEYELLNDGVSPEDIPCHNTVMLLDVHSDNNFFIVDKYHKIHLVPFGEYTPFGEYFPEIKKAFGMGRDMSPGKRFTLFELKKGVYGGVNICYEDIFPEISANFAKRGANLLLVLTNDAWYPASSEAEQHLANAVFRTVETRLPMIRAGNNSCSTLILPNGVIKDSVSVKEDGSLDPSANSRGYANFTIDILKKPELTFYTKHPYMFLWICFIIVAAAFFHSIWSWREIKQKKCVDIKTG